MAQLFLSYSRFDSIFVSAVAGQLQRSFERVYVFEEYEKPEPINNQIRNEINNSDCIVFFIGQKTSQSDFQKLEARFARRNNIRSFIVQLPDDRGNHYEVPKLWGRPICLLPSEKPFDLRFPSVTVVTKRICSIFERPWVSRTGLPIELNLFSYEKDIIRAYQRLSAPGVDLASEAMADVREMIIAGLPPAWPKVAEIPSRPGEIGNKLVPRIGKARSQEAMVAVSALRPHDQEATGNFGFPEAGPRAKVRLTAARGERPFKVAVIVVGGIAPGINAVIDGIVNRHWLYAKEFGYENELQVHGCINGLRAFDIGARFASLVTNGSQNIKDNFRIETPAHAHEGGSIIGTSRDEELTQEPAPGGRLDQIVDWLTSYEVLYVIGGDGGMRFAHAIWTLSQAPQPLRRRENNNMGVLSVVGVPKTMDNDILWVWQSFGFMSAVEKAREFVENMHTEIASNPRLGIIQLFGSVSGFVVSHAILAGAAPMCDVALVPEIEFSLAKVAAHLKQRLLTRERGSVPKGLVVMAETALPTDVTDLLDQLSPPLAVDERAAVEAYLKHKSSGRPMIGHTSDELRSGCLKVVARGLEYLLKQQSAADPRWEHLRVVTNEPRHIIRAIPPSSQDIIVGRRLGTLAVDNAIAGYTDFMISQWLTEFVLVPLPLVVLGRKQIHRDGIFWKSVLSKTDAFDLYA